MRLLLFEKNSNTNLRCVLRNLTTIPKQPRGGTSGYRHPIKRINGHVCVLCAQDDRDEEQARDAQTNMRISSKHKATNHYHVNDPGTNDSNQPRNLTRLRLATFAGDRGRHI